MTVEVEIALLDVGHGVCVAMASGQEAILIDCPPSGVVERWLRRRGISRIRHLVISHFDKDHCGGFDGLLASGFRFDRLWFTDDHMNDTRAYLDLSAVLSDAGARGLAIPSGYPHSLEAPIEWRGIRIEWLLPSRGRRMRPGNRNSLSVVCRVVADGCSILCLGDVDLPGWRNLDANRDVASDWVLAAHHGGGARTRQAAVLLIRDVIDRSRARYVYFSMSRSRYRLPIPEVVRAASAHATVACSQVSKHCAPSLTERELCVHEQGTGCEQTPRSCCAGTVALKAESGFRWRDESKHSNVVGGLQQPLCNGALRS